MTDRAGIYLLFALAAAMALTISAAIMAPAIGLAGNDSAPSANLNPRDFSTNIDNPLFPLSTLGPKTFEGQDTDRIQAKSSPHDSNRPCWARLARSQVSRYWCSKRRFLRTTSLSSRHSTSSPSTRTARSTTSASSSTTTKAARSWTTRAPGLPARTGPNRASSCRRTRSSVRRSTRENAPGVAQDQSRVRALDETVKTPAGKFKGCAKFEDTNPLDPQSTAEFKWYCPDVGLVRDEDAEGFIELVSYTIRGAGASATSERISDVDVSQSDDGSGDGDD